MQTKFENIHPIDSYVGRKLRFKRKMLYLTQSDLAKKIDKTFQQVQKYEKGDNRISASILYELALILKVNISYFFEDFEEQKFPISEVLNDVIFINAKLSVLLKKNPEKYKITMKSIKNLMLLTE